MTGLRTLLLVAALVPFAAGAQDSLDDAFDRDVLVIVAHQACYRFDIYLALNTPQQRRGLMGVRKLPATTGMLFAYRNDAYRSMWMKNTYIPLDMVFARHDGTVTNVIANTVPQSEESLTSSEPVAFVLELNAGTAQRLGIDEQSRLLWEPALQ